MKIGFLKAAALYVLVGASSVVVSAQRGQTGAACDKACLQGGTISDRTMNFAPFDLEAAHIYKIFGGKLHEIEAMGFPLPLNSKNGWSPFIK